VKTDSKTISVFRNFEHYYFRCKVSNLTGLCHHVCFISQVKSISACLQSTAQMLLMWYVSWKVANECVFSADLKVLELDIGFWGWSGCEFQANGPAAENSQRLQLLWQCRRMISWWQLSEWSLWHWLAAVNNVLGSSTLKTPVDCHPKIRWGIHNQCS